MAEIDQPRPASAWTSTSSPCVSIGRGLSAAAGLEHRQQRVGPRPIRWTRPSGWPDPGAQTWGDSVISSGEIPLIRDTPVLRMGTGDSAVEAVSFGREAPGKACGVPGARRQGNSWTPPPSTGRMVNVGTSVRLPSRPGRQWAGPSSAVGPAMGRSRRSSPRSGKPATWRRAAARPQDWHWMGWRSPVNAGAPWPTPREAAARVQRNQVKLHRWATDDPRRRFDDLYNLVCD